MAKKQVTVVWGSDEGAVRNSVVTDNLIQSRSEAG